jgi:hypothetical protein
MEVRDTLNRSLLGWAHYFSYGTYRRTFRSIDFHVYERVPVNAVARSGRQEWPSATAGLFFTGASTMAR